MDAKTLLVGLGLLFLLVAVGTLVWIAVKTEKLEVATLRPNLLIIAGLIAFLSSGIVVLIAITVTSSPESVAGKEAADNNFIVGALIGLLGSGLTGLSALGTTLANENDKADTGRPVNSSGKGHPENATNEGEK